MLVLLRQAEREVIDAYRSAAARSWTGMTITTSSQSPSSLAMYKEAASFSKHVSERQIAVVVSCRAK